VREVTELLKPNGCESLWVMYVAKFKAAGQVLAFVDKHPSEGSEVIAAFNSVLLGSVSDLRQDLPETVNTAAKKMGCVVEREKSPAR